MVNFLLFHQLQSLTQLKKFDNMIKRGLEIYNLYKNESANVKFFKRLGVAIDESIDTNIEQYDRHSPAFVANVLGNAELK